MPAKVAEVAVVLWSHSVNGPASSATKIEKFAIPESASVPLQETVNVSEVCVAASGATWLAGLTLSIVLIQTGVSIGALVSNTMRAWLAMIDPDANPVFGL